VVALAVVVGVDGHAGCDELPAALGLTMNVYTAAAGTPSADGLKLLASWAASQESLATESTPTPVS
jgi:hypothetical protein